MAKPAPPVLYHYTSEIHLPSILREGRLRRTDSNIGFDGSGPPVVWLTTTTDPGGNGLDGGFGKGAVRLTIDASGLPIHHWPTWSFEQGIEGYWYDALDSAGGGGSENWWVCTKEIPLDRVLTIEVNGVPYGDWGKKGSLSTEAAGSIDEEPDANGRYFAMGEDGEPVAYQLRLWEDDFFPDRNERKLALWNVIAVEEETGRECGHLALMLEKLPDAPAAVKSVDREGRSWYVRGVGVDPQHQRRGLATAMWAMVHRRFPTVPAVHGTNAQWEMTQEARALFPILQRRWPRLHLKGDHTLHEPVAASLHTEAMPVGPPPEIRWKHGPVRWFGVTPKEQYMLKALTPEGETIGHLRWVTKAYQRPFLSAGEILNVFVHEKYRRRGVATLMLEKARSIDPNVRHSGTLTEDGKAWSQAVASLQSTGSIKGYLDANIKMREMLRDSGQIPADWSYVGIDDLIATHGRTWPKIGKGLPEGLARGSLGDCYMNALNAAMENPDLTYVEGYATTGFIPLGHAWVVDKQGTVYDPTWTDGTAKEYFGVPLDLAFVKRVIVESGYYSVFHQDIPPKTIQKALREGLPGNAIRRVGSLMAEADLASHVLSSYRDGNLGEIYRTFAFDSSTEQPTTAAEAVRWLQQGERVGIMGNGLGLHWTANPALSEEYVSITTPGEWYLRLTATGVSIADIDNNNPEAEWGYGNDYGFEQEITLVPTTSVRISKVEVWSHEDPVWRTLPGGCIRATAAPLFDSGYTDEDMKRFAEEWKNLTPRIIAPDPDRGFIAIVHGVPVGQILWTIEEDERAYSDDDEIAAQARGDHNGHYPRIESLAVDRAFRRRGIATLLLKAFIDYADRYYYGDFDPGGFTKDGAAFWKAVRGETVPVTQNITYSSRATAAVDWKKSPGGNSYRTSTVGKNGVTYYITGSFESFKAFWESPAEDGYATPQWCGSLSVWSGLSGGRHEVFKVHVNPEHRRQGVASAMFDLAKVDNPDLTHAGPGALSDDGKGFAAGHPASLRTAAEQRVEVSGVALVARDTGRVLMLQRALTEDDENGGKWEFPGGHHEDGDTTSLHAAIREWEEEVGQRFPEGGEVVDTWTSPDGIYRGHVVVIAEEAQLALHVDRVVDNPDEDGFEQAAWWDPEDARKNPALREECKKTPWDKFKVSAPKEGSKMDIADEFGSLFDEVPPLPQPQADLTQRTAAEWGDDLSYAGENFAFAGPNTPHPGLGHTMNADFVGSPYDDTIDDDPEAALPVTYGDDADTLAQQVAAALGGAPVAPARPVAARQPGESEMQRGMRLLAYADAVARGETPPGPNPFAHVAAGQDDNEMAAAAQNYLATKTALKTYDPIERQAIIDEGQEVRAGNLDRLDIAGTHYEALEATSARSEDEDLTFLDGDPNLGDF